MAVAIEHFTDPTCPFAFSAERQRLRIAWLYGDGITWTTRLVVLSRTEDEILARGLTLERLAASLARIQRLYGMPIATGQRERHVPSVAACRAVVATRRHDACAADALLRRLRVLQMGALAPIDEPAAIARAAREAGVDPDALAAWLAEPASDAELEADAALARSPAPAAVHLHHKLARNGDGWRYTCPSLRLTAGGITLDVPGFQPVEACEVAIANLAPDLPRRADAASAAEVLAWAGMPLATAEVAAVRGIEPDEARAELGEVAAFEPVGADGYWTLAG